MNQNTDHLMVKPEAAHIIKLTCAHCGGQQLFQLPINLIYFIHLSNQFRQIHQACPAPLKEFEG